MKRFYFVILFFVTSLVAKTQTQFRTLAPQHAIIAGEAFQVQYILEDGKKGQLLSPPSFKGFRKVSGPDVYSGHIATINGVRPVYNMVYTLEAIRPGVYIIPGVTAIVNDKPIRSNDLHVEVISKEEALQLFGINDQFTSSAYFLSPGEDPYKKIRENLFIRLDVDKKTCMVGEPVVATFKLYSRLESKSDIVKNPGFYGFTVFDIVNLADKDVTSEQVKGKRFDVHTIRKVQLYPLRPGTFSIDAMELENSVEFSRTLVNKRTEQEIAEGIFGSDAEGDISPGTDIFETHTNTEPVTIKVKPVPEANKPAAFTGAVGKFHVSASVTKNSIDKNEEGLLAITISGAGNFTQLDAPVVTWPAGLEGFAARVKDNLDKFKVPLQGSRTFYYPFVGIAAGKWELTPVKFSFFDIDSNRFNILETNPVEVWVSNRQKEHVKSQSPGPNSPADNLNTINFVSVLILVVLAVIFFLNKRLKNRNTGRVYGNNTETIVEDDPLEHVESGSAAFYSTLYVALWKILSKLFDLEGSEINKQALISKMKVRNIPDKLILEIINLIQTCEAGRFTAASIEEDKEKILSRSKNILRAMRQY